MRITRAVLQSLNHGPALRIHQSHMTRLFSIAAPGYSSADKENSNSFESADDFEHRIFGDFSGSGSRADSFFQKLDRIERAKSGPKSSGGDSSSLFGESISTLSDNMDNKLEKAARYFEYDSEEVEQENYSFRPDMNLEPGVTYEPKDLDLRRPGVQRRRKRAEFEVTTNEVLRKADFRNVRFLANFITEAGIIIKRSQTGISAKAQRRVAREIKTARAFGLMPFTTMGTKSFVFGKTMESLDEDYEYEVFDGRGAEDMEE